MSDQLQTIVVLVIVALAAAYMLLRAVRVFIRKKSAGCGGGCHGCGSAKSTTQPTLISIEPSPSPPRRS